MVPGQTALMTGASFGVGVATARKAAEAAVPVVARSADRLDRSAASINAGGGRAVANPADLADEAAFNYRRFFTDINSRKGQ